MDKEFLEKTEKRPLELTEDDFLTLKKIYREENSLFRKLIKKTVGRVRGRNDYPVISYLFKNLNDELIDISPFLSQELNRLFRSMIDWGFLKGLAELDSLIAACGNPQVLTLMKENVIIRPDIYKFLNNLEIYKIKKTVHDLSLKFNQMDEIVVKLEMELSQEDMKWRDYPE